MINTAITVRLPDGKTTKYETLGNYVIVAEDAGRWIPLAGTADRSDAEQWIMSHAVGTWRDYKIIPVDQPVRPEIEMMALAYDALYRAAVNAWGMVQLADRRDLKDPLYKSWRAYINHYQTRAAQAKHQADPMPHRYIY